MVPLVVLHDLLRRLRLSSMHRVLLLLVFAYAVAQASSVVNLGESSWEVVSGNGSVTAATTLPAYPLEVLRRDGIINDPLYRYGELESRWVALEKWTFTLNFSGNTPAMQQLLHEKEVLLKFGGIDTFATVTLNGQTVLEANNFHRHWTIAVKDLLLPGNNQLVIAIRPAMQESLQLKDQYPYPVPTIHQMGSIGAYNFVRKPASDGGWDWGPAYLASGIHGNVELVGFSNALLEDAWVQQNKVEDQFEVIITSDLLVPPNGDSGVLTVAIPELNLQATQQVKIPQITDTTSSSRAVTRASFTTNVSVDASKVELWWPAGYGSPRLYNVTVTYTPDQSVCPPAAAAAAAATAAAAGQKESGPQKAVQTSTPATAGTAGAVPVSTASFSAPLPAQAAAAAASVHKKGYAKIALLQDHQTDMPVVEPHQEAAAASGSYKIEANIGQYASDSIEATAHGGSDLVPSLSQEVVESRLDTPDTTSNTPNPSTPPSAASKQQLSACNAVSSRTYRIGFRTVQLVRLPLLAAVKDLFPPGESGWDVNSTLGVTKGDKDGSWALSAVTGKWQWVPYPGNVDVEGESFYFKVNGVPIYMKGANMIPMNVLPTNVTKDMIHDMLDYALESNMNMVRIWGGGMYPVPEVFNYADEKGLLTWMETMFACAPYPRDVSFLNNIKIEVTQQVHRLSWHPSIVAWSGNNEIEGSLGWYAESRTNRELFAGDYIALFIDTVRAIIKKANPSMPFVDSSPSNGAIVDTPEQYVKRWGGDWDPRYGDVHYYAYDADCEDWTTYPKAKFISEFGSQSYPTFQTYASVTAPEDWQVDNNMTGFKNRRFGNGLEVFEAQFQRHFRLPATWSVPNDPKESYRLFRSFIYITHVQQARCYETAINYWRRLRSQPAGLNMGVLYWQLNDIAQFASWSSYDYGGRWKPLAYAVKRMYAPLQAQVFQDGIYTKVFVVNDHTVPVTVSVNMQLRALADNSNTCQQVSQKPDVPVSAIAIPNANITIQSTVPPGFASQVLVAETAEILSTIPGCTKATCYLDVTVTRNNDEPSAAQPEVSEAQLFFVPLKDIDLPDPGLRISGFQQVRPQGGANVNSSQIVSGNSSDPVAFTLSASRPAILTYLNTKYRGRFSDDAFTALHPCKPKQITFYPHSSEQGVTADDLAADLTVESLFDHQFGTVAAPARPAKRAASKTAGK